MAISGPYRRLCASLLIPSLFLLHSSVSATPSVNVALQASFNAGPYLLELLETAASENATAYFPLLDRIAEGAFEDLTKEKDLYDRFLTVVKEDGHLRDDESLSSFKFALAIRSAAPRIEAHYQYYNTSIQPFLMAAQDAACPTWVHMQGKQYCSSTLERAQQDVAEELETRALPFDRTLGESSATPSILYADITSPMFGDFHQKLSALAKDGQISYRLRHRPPQHGNSQPLFVTGWGVELALKRTDYIVIDDRQAEANSKPDEKRPEAVIPDSEDSTDETLDDLKPLSASEVARLGVNAASFVLDSGDPFETLLKLSQDFPKYSATVASYNASDAFLMETQANRVAGLPPGYNIMWINGIQMDHRKIDAYSLLEHLRRERALIANFEKLGLSPSEAVSILSNPAVGQVQADDEPQRYNWRDEPEGGNVIMWMNDLEKDKRYEGWPKALMALLGPSYPGQLPNIGRDIHNVIIPVDLANRPDIKFVVEMVQSFVKRKIPVRFGLVPTTNTEASIANAKIAHHLQTTYGLAAVMQYLEIIVSQKKAVNADKTAFKSTVEDRPTRSEAPILSFEEVLGANDLDETISRTTNYLKRLDCDGINPPIIVNGMILSRNDNFLQELSIRLGRDLQLIQQALLQRALQEDTWVPTYFLFQAIETRNEWIAPEDPSSIRILNLPEIVESHGQILAELPHIPSDEGYLKNNAHIIVVADLTSSAGLDLLTAALEFRKLHLEAEIVLVHNPENEALTSKVATDLYHLGTTGKIDVDALLSQINSLRSAEIDVSETTDEELAYWFAYRDLVRDLGFAPGDRGLLLNGRAIGPLPPQVIFGADAFEQLFAFELSKRLEPVTEALLDLDLQSKVADTISFAKLTSLVALSTIPDAPEGIYESTTSVRMEIYKKWGQAHSTLNVSQYDGATIQIVATIDPASETAQRWLPILKTLSKLSGVNTQIFMNPRDQMQELPIKRFYRYMVDSEPLFDDAGSLVRPGASFTWLPKEALLNLGMDVPSSWLVAPKESIYDLDNIKLSSVKEGANVEAIYELEHILIEGHSRDTTSKMPPRGVQLLLGTDNNPHFEDTIIMANLGYFQFKAQPGFWKINLKPGRSEKIFNLDSVGGFGHIPTPGDENNEVALLSFQGKTLFPRLSRKPGHEEDEVLELGPKPGSAMDYVSKGWNFASGVLSSVGVNPKSESAEKQADINIFSVASGHLYERMLNIMMVSVMRHTKHTVKFWFIEQFLSPSFKTFLPHLAEEYGFSYEMVTYKWPHWLRGQREKQREIWGYKILFLDVLFPLSLDKVIFVDADQIVRTDLYDLVSLDLEGAPYGFTPMCDSREEMEGFRFWKQGYWKTYLDGLPYHISALYVVDLNQFRALAAGDRLRGQYQTLSADPNSLSNLDQDLPNHMQHMIPIKSLPQEWLWCETWCSDEALATARTIDLCNNPLTKEPKLDRARRQVPEWTLYDEEIAALAKRVAEAQQHGDATEIPKTEPEKQEGSAWRKDEL